MIKALNRWLEWLLEGASIILLLSLALVVVLAVIFRFSGSSLVWYDADKKEFLKGQRIARVDISVSEVDNVDDADYANGLPVFLDYKSSSGENLSTPEPLLKAVATAW